ncbi:MAG: vanadium-dependent haloperoxidase [Bacteroidota bacterium]
MSKKIVVKILNFSSLLFLFALIAFSCRNERKFTFSEEKIEFSETDVANSWAQMTIYITKNTLGNTPTYASRALGYIGLTMYESIVQGYIDEYESIAPSLNDSIAYKPLFKTISPQKINWIISLNAGQAEILRSIYNQTSDYNKFKIDSLENLIFESTKYFNKNKIYDFEESKDYGKSMAVEIFEKSKTDGGHRAYLKNFDKSLKFDQKPGGWKPPLYGQSISHFPLHPHWGQNRTFLKENSIIPDPKFIPFSVDPKSDYYRQFLAVYKKQKTLTQAEKEAAIWWGDDPDETPTPPGHSYFLASLVLKNKKASLIKCAETYAKLGMGLSDAFRNCWKWKYHFFSERPNTYITEHIDNQWVSFWPDPPFPAFPSGHAIQAAAAATILTDLFGPKIIIVDSTHVGRKRDEIRNVDFKVRKFSSFWEIANETANSRFYGGIHTPQDNEAGLIKGKEIGQNINKLKWKK